jgi:hypothetical protein
MRLIQTIDLGNGMELVGPARGYQGITPRMLVELANRQLNNKSVAEILSPIKGLSGKCHLRYR